MNTKLVYALAGALALGFTTYSHAEDKPEHKPEGRGQRGGGFSVEQREKFAKEVGLDPEELKKLTPEERMAKFKEASEKKTAELEKKKADGTITDAEKETLSRLEMRKQWSQGGGNRAGSPEDRDKMLKEIGLNPDDIKDLPPQERFSKIREAAKAKTEELKKKQTDGTITDAEKETLKRLEARQQGGRDGGRPRRGDKSSDDKK